MGLRFSLNKGTLYRLRKLVNCSLKNLHSAYS